MRWTHLSDARPKAIKQHRCHLCGLIIQVGEVHIARRGFGDDGPLTARMHVNCEAVTHIDKWDIDDWETADECGFRERMEELFPGTAAAAKGMEGGR